MLTRELPAERMDPRARRTRQLIIDAFFALLQEKTFEAITVQDIAERATVNRATFYAHFEDKYSLLDHAFNETFQKFLASKLPPGSRLNPTSLERLIQAICEYLEQIHSHCAPSTRKQFDTLVEQQVKQQLYELLRRWLLEDSPKRTTNPDQLQLQATITSWAIYGAAMRWSTSARKESAAAFARQALPLIMSGLAAQSAATDKATRAG